MYCSISKTGLSVQMENSSVDSIPLSSGNNWIVLLQRFGGSLDCNQNWSAYRNGFGDAEQGEFWFGIEKVHLLTNRTGLTYRLRVEVFVDQYQCSIIGYTFKKYFNYKLQNTFFKVFQLLLPIT